MKATRHSPVLGRQATTTPAIGYVVLAPAWAIVANSDTVCGAPTASVQQIRHHDGPGTQPLWVQLKTVMGPAQAIPSPSGRRPS
jgi:hypothetical protein